VRFVAGLNAANASLMFVTLVLPYLAHPPAGYVRRALSGAAPYPPDVFAVEPVVELPFVGWHL
jgi:hypothetical protein